MPTTNETRVCKWHLCGATFTPAKVSQDFCSAGCRTARLNWRQARGSRLVDPLLDFDLNKLEELRTELQKEIANG